MPKARKGIPDLMTVSKAAQELGVSHTQIYRWLSAGKLDEYEVQGQIRLITRKSIETLKGQRK